MNNKRILAVAASACLAVFASSANAAGFDYSFGEIGYRNVDGDLSSGDGFRASFSYGATDYFHVVGDYSRLWIDDLKGTSRANVDFNEFKIGGGGHYPVTDKIDIVGQVTYVDDNYNGQAALPGGGGAKTTFNDTEEGYEATLFGRIQAAKKLEMTPHMVYRNVGSESDTGFGLGLVYKFKKKLAIRIRGTHFSDESTTNLFAGVRLYM